MTALQCRQGLVYLTCYRLKKSPPSRTHEDLCGSIRSFSSSTIPHQGRSQDCPGGGSDNLPHSIISHRDHDVRNHPSTISRRCHWWDKKFVSRENTISPYLYRKWEGRHFTSRMSCFPCIFFHTGRDESMSTPGSTSDLFGLQRSRLEVVLKS